MAEKNIEEVDALPANRPAGTRLEYKGGEWVFDGAEWLRGQDWDALTPQQKNERISAAFQANVDAAGNNDLYDPNDEEKVRAELLRLKPVERENVLKKLYEAGQYGGSSRGNGFNPADISAFSSLLWYANYKKKDFKSALIDYERDFAKRPDLLQGVGRKPPRQVTNTDEIRAVFNKTAQNMLGRKLPDNVAEQFVRTIQTQQATFQQQLATQSGGTLMQPADVGLSAAPATYESCPTRETRTDA